MRFGGCSLGLVLASWMGVVGLKSTPDNTPQWDKGRGGGDWGWGGLGGAGRGDLVVGVRANFCDFWTVVKRRCWG